jgi:hypothetical protein
MQAAACYIKKAPQSFDCEANLSAPEKIRTPDTTVRSRMLYPAELLTHTTVCLPNGFLNSAKPIIYEVREKVNTFLKKIKK